MKKIQYIFLLGLLISFTACEDLGFIEPKPEDRITTDLALADLNGVDAHIARGYNRMINFNTYGRNMFLVPDALADNLERLQNNVAFAAFITNASRSHLGLWGGTGNFSVRGGFGGYVPINDAEIALNALEDLASEDPARARIIEGRAKFLRALNYFDMLKVYAYTPGQEVGGFNLGVPIRNQAVLGLSNIEQLPRATNVEGYEFVEQDLLDAISLLPTEANEANFPYFPTSTAAKALLSRVYLYWGRFADAATRAEEVMGETSATVQDAAGYVAAWGQAQMDEEIFSLNVSSVDWNSVDGVNNSLASFTNTNDPGRGINNPRAAVSVTQELRDAHEAGDVRGDLYVDPVGLGFFESRKWPGELGNFREHLPVLRFSEMLLIAAEGRARSGNDAAAQTHINNLRTNRGLAATAATGTTLTDLIMNERRVELALEGHRFFDFKRLGMNIPKSASSGVPTLDYTDFRVLSPVPNNALNNNENLVNNPGY